MAVTKIIPIRFTIEKSVDYICNPRKTLDGLYLHSEHCVPQTAALTFRHHLRQARAGGNTIGRHLIQSFAPEEVTPEKAHEIGKALAAEILGGKYAFVLATHVDRGHIFDKQEALRGKYAFVAKEPTPNLAERQQQLRDRLAENFEAYKSGMLGLNKESLFESAAEILPVQEVYAYFTQEQNYLMDRDYLADDIDFLLKFQNPLAVIADKWADSASAVETVDKIFINQAQILQQGRYTLVAEPKSVGTLEKASVMEQLRKARAETKEKLAPQKDLPGKDHEPEH